MRFAGYTLALAGIFASHALGQAPTIGGVLNNYSNTLPGLPNYGIAQGSIAAIYGTNFTATSVGATLPLQTTLGGVSVSVTVGTTTTNALIYFVSSTQINAVIPSATPVGTGTITVTNGAGTSSGFAITIVASDFGLLTTNYGSGPAQGYDASINPNNQYILFGLSEAANPGDTLELWGTGLGPVQGDGTYVSIPGAQVLIGGVSAQVSYSGRSGYPGLDQINVVVPKGVTGCYVSVVVQTGNYVSNFGTLAVTDSGRTCTDSNSPLTTALLEQLFTTGSLSVGTVSVSQLTLPGVTVGGVTIGGSTIDAGSASFSTITSAQFTQGAFAAALGGFSSLGSCFVDFFTTTNTSTTSLPLNFQFTSLNAGPDINITGPDGTLAMPLTTTNGVYSYSTNGLTQFIPAAGGSFTFSGTGGPAGGVGAFTTPAIEMAAPVTFTDASSISPVTRSSGLTVNWTGGQAGSFVGITGFSLAAESGANGTYLVGFFSCRAPVAAGTFTVPASVLQELPVSSTLSENGITESLGFLLLSNLAAPGTFTATGIDLGLVEAGVEEFLTVAYQ